MLVMSLFAAAAARAQFFVDQVDARWTGAGG